MSDENNIDDNDLKQLRNGKGLSLSEVSDQLKLTKDVITKLEKSQFNELGAYAYVRGYLNHYARLLGVDAQKYLDLVPKSKIDVTLVNTSSQLSKSIKLKRHSTNMANYMIGTFVVVAISFSGWFLLKNYSGISNKPTTSIEITQPITDNFQNDNSTAEMAVNTQDAEQQESYHYSSLIPSEEQNKNVDSANNIDESQLLIPQKQTVDDKPASLEKNNKINDIAYEIKVIASETSWVKIEKLDGTKLHNDLLKPGEIIVHSNEAVHFRIGNGDNIKVSINGEEINLSSYTKKNIADFKWPLDS
jgi:cytoskeleton protein RodZ